jgi:hypothetical protein
MGISLRENSFRRTELPPTRSDIDVYSSLDDLSAKRIAGLIEEAAKANAPVGSNARKIAEQANASSASRSRRCLR